MSDEKVTRIERVRVLQGHVDADSAYVVKDYPYGGGLRCTKRYWVETATKGRAKGKQRYVSQTTNPRRPDRRWNKPHPETYAEMVVLYLDGEDHVKWWSTGLWMSAADDARTRMMGIYDQFTDEQRRMYDALRKYAERNRSSWGEFEEAVTALAAEIRHTGREPRFTAQGWTVWDTPDGRRFSLGDPPDVEVHLAAAREGWQTMADRESVPAIPTWLSDMDTVGGLVVPWVTMATASGRRLFSAISHPRMHLAFERRLCGVCGRPLEDRLVLLMRLSDMPYRRSFEPAVHPVISTIPRSQSLTDSSRRSWLHAEPGRTSCELNASSTQPVPSCGSSSTSVRGWSFRTGSCATCTTSRCRRTRSWPTPGT